MQLCLLRLKTWRLVKIRFSAFYAHLNKSNGAKMSCMEVMQEHLVIIVFISLIRCSN
jgi:hypothetical protein